MYKTLTALTILATSAAAEEAIVTQYDGAFEDARFSVENAIVNKGLVIDYVSRVGEMLNRTGTDVGSDKTLFENAEIFIFCSAVISREVMEEDPMNIVHCPYSIFVAETADGVMIGHRDFPAGPMDKVEALLKEIVAEAAEF
jgi:uncharacterized protein (DUF302 family)